MAVFCSFAAQAAELNPSEQAQWQRLLHLQSAQESRFASQDALLTSAGPQLAQRELLASLHALRQPESAASFSCRFPARTAFLRRVFSAELSDVPEVRCPEYEAWREKTSVQQVTLVFAASYLSNPSSMFGHTLLRLDGELASRNALLSYAVNFAAQATDAKGFSFAWKGMTGGYAGRFGVYAYYDKVREYAQIENRDLWEYPLQLKSEQIDRLLAHLWELQTIDFDYFFFAKNCSFQLLALLEVAKPELDLTAGYTVWASPIDTIRRLRQQAGLVGEVAYRPALHTRIQQRLQGLSLRQREILIALLDGAPVSIAQDLSAAEQAGVAELMHDWAYYQTQNDTLVGGRLNAKARRGLLDLKQAALHWRSANSEPAEFASIQAPVAPDQGHKEQRFRLGWTQDDLGNSAAVFGWRPVLHDALDAGAGYARGSSIDVLDLSFAAAQGEVFLHQLTAIKIESRSPRDAFFSPWSWLVDVAYSRAMWSQPGYAHVRGGLGATWPLRSDVQVHLGGLGQVLAGADSSRAVTLGLEAGLRGQWMPNWSWQLEGRAQTLLADNVQGLARRRMQAFNNRLSLNQQWQFSEDVGLRVEASRAFVSGYSSIQASLMWFL